MKEIRCACGAWVPDIEGPVHRYMTSAPGCWERYGELLRRNYENTDQARCHNVIVDAYAVQHPGNPVPSAIRSVYLHLTCLYIVYERQLKPEISGRFLSADKDKSALTWLEPPTDFGAVNVAQVYAAKNPDEYAALVRAWGLAAWQAWGAHHAAIRRFAGKYL